MPGNIGIMSRTPSLPSWGQAALAEAPILADLRAREERLRGHCGECAYRRLCGGCRGRTWTTTGDYLAEDLSCFIHELWPAADPATGCAGP